LNAIQERWRKHRGDPAFRLQHIATHLSLPACIIVAFILTRLHLSVAFILSVACGAYWDFECVIHDIAMFKKLSSLSGLAVLED